MTPSPTRDLDSPERPARVDVRRNVRAILEAAARVLTADDTASMEQIAKAAGFARLTLYRHFPTRDALIGALTDEMLEGMREAATTALERTQAGTVSGADAIAELLRDLASVTARYPSILGPQPGQPTRAQLEFRDAFTATVLHGQRDGSIAEDVDPVFLRQIALGGLATLLHCAPEGESELHDAGATIAAMLLRGARPRGAA